VKVRRIVPIAGVLAGALVLAAPRPAGAAVSVSSAGTTITVTMTGYESASFRCTGGNVVVANASTTFTPSPAVSCAALTQVTVNGDGDSQEVDASGLNASAFAAKPKLIASLGNGVDELTETQNADTIDLGGGSDQLYLRRGLAINTSVEMGAGTLDNATLIGTDASEDFTVASTGANTTFAQALSGSPALTYVVKNVEYVDVDGGKGDDDLDATGLTIGSAIVLVDLDGDEGNDVLRAGSRPSRLNGGSGTNTFFTGPNADEVETVSDTDTINGATDPADDQIRDDDSLRFGGRALTGFGNSGGSPVDTFYGRSIDNDVVVRVRPGASGAALMTLSLNRMGQQAIPAGIEAINTSTNGMSPVSPRTLVDVVVPAQDVTIGTTTSEKELIDITVPAGVWTNTASSGTRTITTASAASGNVSFSDGATYKVHGPWTNQNQGFGHRVVRDLLLRFATDAERDAVRDQLTAGTATRATIVTGIIFTDEYRGTDVDRVFVRYLRRVPDPGGRSYWIGALRNGRSLRVFRAQLFGSNEYFTKAGGTNAAFVARAYEDVLGRTPDPSGQAYWTTKANNGTERGQIARQFLASAEAKRTIVRDQFLRFLDRQPTANELATWTASLDSNANGEQALIAFLAGTSAYFQRT